MKVFNFFIFLFLVFTINNEGFSQGLPIKPARTISFETEEGSRMNLAISPNGKTLLFDLLGDIYILPVEGGKAVQITRGLALHINPLFSEDGNKLLYLSDGTGDMKIHVSDLDGSNEKVAGNFEKELFIKSNEPENSKDWPQGAIMSKNGRFLAYISRMKYKSSTLTLRDLETGLESTLVPQLSTSHNYGQKFCFSPDSKSIYISYGGKIHQISTEKKEDKVVPFKANVNSDLGKLNHHTFRVSHEPFNSNYIRSTVASPDRKQLYFVALSQLHRMSLADGKTSPLVKQDMGQFQPAVSPDGKWVAYVTWNDKTAGSLWKVSASGGEPVKLTTIPGHYQQPSWSPDGQSIAVVRGGVKQSSTEDFEFGKLELVNTNTLEVNLVTGSVPLWNNISFSLDGKRIYYRLAGKKEGFKNSAEIGVHPVIVSSELDGKNLQVIVKGELELENLLQTRLYRQHQQLSPDGKYMVYAEHESLFLVPVQGQDTQLPVMYGKTRNPKAIRFAIGMDPHWEDGGKIISWTFGNTFFRVRTEKIVETAEQSKNYRKFAGFSLGEYCTAEVEPDEIVDIKVEVPSLYGKGTIALKNVRIISMKGSEIIENGTILIKDGRIEGLGAADKVNIPKSAEIKDLSGASVMPGMIDLHLHMLTPSNIFPQQNQVYLASLAYGVTTARDPYVKFDSYANSELLMAGKMIGPRIYSVGRPAKFDTALGVERMSSIEDASYFVRKRKELGSVVIKQYALKTRLQRQWLLMASEEANLNMTNEGDAWLENLAEIKDGSSGVEHDPDDHWTDVYSDVATFLSKSGTFLTPTLQVMYTLDGKKWKDYFNYNYWRNPDEKLKRFLDPSDLEKLVNASPILDVHNLTDPKFNARLRKMGAQIGMGSHGDNKGTGPHSELWALQLGGMTNMEALQSATIIGAKALGMDRDLGSIEVGKIADLIILNKNPLDDIHNSREIRYVMKDGVLYDGDTLETLWPFKRPAPEWRYKGEYEALIKHSDKP